MGILKATSYEDIIKILRRTVIDTLHINENNVVNGASVRGADLQIIIDGTKKYTSISMNDSFIVFVLNENSDKYYTTREDDGSYSQIRGYDFDMKIYGNHSHLISQKLSVIFKNETLLIELRNKGIYFHGISNTKSNHELINNNFWERCDLTIKVQVRHSFQFEDEGFFNYQEKPKLIINQI